MNNSDDYNYSRYVSAARCRDYDLWAAQHMGGKVNGLPINVRLDSIRVLNPYDNALAKWRRKHGRASVPLSVQVQIYSQTGRQYYRSKKQTETNDTETVNQQGDCGRIESSTFEQSPEVMRGLLYDCLL